MNDDRAKLAAEVVFSMREGQLNKKDTGYLIDNLVFQDMSLGEAEDEMLKRAKDGKKLEFILRGYKFREEFEDQDDSVETTKKKVSKKIQKGSDSK
ncbi:hypothetical protein KKB18_07525 [bacterium]|nr:hypothetical protein [bacterium]